MEKTAEIDQREKDVQGICSAILNMSPVSVNNMSGPDYSYCPMCYKEGNYHGDIQDIKHELSCAYLIAKDLSTNLL